MSDDLELKDDEELSADELQKLRDLIPAKKTHRFTKENAAAMQLKGRIARQQNQEAAAGIIAPDPDELSKAKDSTDAARLWVKANFETIMRRILTRAMVSDKLLSDVLRCLIRDREEETRSRSLTLRSKIMTMNLSNRLKCRRCGFDSCREQ